MQTLLKLARYSAWGNRRMWETCEAAGPALVVGAADGMVGSIAETLKHLVGVEDVYLAMLRGEGPETAFGSREAYFGQDLAWFRRRSEELGDAYPRLLAAKDESWLDGSMRVPWFDFPLRLRDGVLQAMTHSAQHRAQVLSALGARGVPIPEMDYVFMVGEMQGAADRRA